MNGLGVGRSSALSTSKSGVCKSKNYMSQGSQYK